MTIVITGAGGVLCGAFARALAADGHKVALLDLNLEAAEAIAGLIPEEELSDENIIPMAFDLRVGPAVAKAVADAARRTGVARI